METPPIKLFDVILHPILKKSWIHFQIEATDQTGQKYYDNSSSYGCYDPPYPAFPCYAGENHFTNKHPYGYTLEPFDVNKIMLILKNTKLNKKEKDSLIYDFFISISCPIG
jgi:hypothetical protein